jgi:hypothetical protein
VAHENSLHSDQSTSVQDSCSALYSDVFNDDSSSHTRCGEGVPNILLKNIPRRATVFLTYIFNSCLKLCYFPKEWKNAVVIPIPKPSKDPSNPLNYRPISRFSSIIKVFERISLIRLYTFTKRSSESSIAHQLNRVLRHVKNKRGRGQSTGMLLLNVEKVFDYVWHDALLYKVIQGGCNIFIARIIHFFLGGHSFQISVGKAVCKISY